MSEHRENTHVCKGNEECKSLLQMLAAFACPNSTRDDQNRTVRFSADAQKLSRLRQEVVSKPPMEWQCYRYCTRTRNSAEVATLNTDR